MIIEAVVNGTMHPGPHELDALLHAEVPDDFILDSMLRPEGPPTLEEIISAADRVRGSR
jgi:hypothetical protein